MKETVTYCDLCDTVIVSKKPSFQWIFNFLGTHWNTDSIVQAELRICLRDNPVDIIKRIDICGSCLEKWRNKRCQQEDPR